MDLIRMDNYIGNPYQIKDYNLIPYSYKDECNEYGIVFIKPRNIFHSWLLMNMSYASLTRLFDCIVYRVQFKIIDKCSTNNFYDDDIFHLLNNCAKSNENLSVTEYLRVHEFDDFSIKKWSSNALLLKFACDNINKIINSYENNSKKYIIGERVGYSNDPEKMDDDEYKNETIRIIKNYLSAGFVDINEYCGFDCSIPFIYLDNNSAYSIIKILKTLYKDKSDMLHNSAKQNSELREKLKDTGVQFFILDDGRCVYSLEEYFYETFIVNAPDYYYESSSKINETFDDLCKKYNYIPSKRWSLRDYLVNEKNIVKTKKSIDQETGLVCSGKSCINVYQGIMLKK